MSSHLFNEMEDTCDRVALINDGHIIDIVDMDKIRNRPVKDFKVEFNNKRDYELFKTLPYKIIRDQEKYNQVTISLPKQDVSKLFNDLKEYDIKFVAEVKYTLEKYFKEILLEKENKNV